MLLRGTSQAERLVDDVGLVVDDRPRRVFAEQQVDAAVDVAGPVGHLDGEGQLADELVGSEGALDGVARQAASGEPDDLVDMVVELSLRADRRGDLVEVGRVGQRDELHDAVDRVAERQRRALAEDQRRVG